MRGFALGSERGDCRRCRQTVERHIYQRRAAARGCGSRCGLKTFPLGSSRIVDVHVRIDKSGENGRFSEVVHRDIRWNLAGRNEAADLSVAHQDRSRPDSIRGRDAM